MDKQNTPPPVPYFPDRKRYKEYHEAHVALFMYTLGDIKDIEKRCHSDPQRLSPSDREKLKRLTKDLEIYYGMCMWQSIEALKKCKNKESVAYYNKELMKCFNCYKYHFPESGVDIDNPRVFELLHVAGLVDNFLLKYMMRVTNPNERNTEGLSIL